MAKAKWTREEGNLPPGVILRHHTMVAGWPLQAELVMTGIGALQVRVNGQNVGKPLLDVTLKEGRRRYMAVLKGLSKPKQMMLPV